LRNAVGQQHGQHISQARKPCLLSCTLVAHLWDFRSGNACHWNVHRGWWCCYLVWTPARQGTTFCSPSLDPDDVQTLHDILEKKQAPDASLKHSDLQFCPNISEPTTLEPIPEKISFLMLIGVLRSDQCCCSAGQSQPVAWSSRPSTVSSIAGKAQAEQHRLIAQHAA
jgi:hypothetical protein